MALIDLKTLGGTVSRMFPKLSQREKEIVRECYNIMTDKDNSDETFEIFWEKFHRHVNLPMLDKERARKAWKKTIKTNKYKATMRIELYAKQKPQHEHEYLRKACYYLSDMLYLDDLVPVGNTDSKEHADRLVAHVRDNTEWVEQVANHYTTSSQNIQQVANKFINRCWLSGTLPTDIGKFKVKLIEYIDKNHGQTNKTNNRLNSYKRLLSSVGNGIR